MFSAAIPPPQGGTKCGVHGGSYGRTRVPLFNFPVLRRGGTTWFPATAGGFGGGGLNFRNRVQGWGWDWRTKNGHFKEKKFDRRSGSFWERFWVSLLPPFHQNSLKHCWNWSGMLPSLFLSSLKCWPPANPVIALTLSQTMTPTFPHKLDPIHPLPLREGKVEYGRH